MQLPSEFAGGSSHLSAVPIRLRYRLYMALVNGRPTGAAIAGYPGFMPPDGCALLHVLIDGTLENINFREHLAPMAAVL